MSSLAERLADKTGTKRILTLDGGGVRGALTLGFLERIETILRERYGKPNYRLCDYYDLIVGTSTGAIIAAGLATGMSAAEIRAKYLELGGVIFGKRISPWMPFFLRPAKYSEIPLEQGLVETFGDITLGDQERIKTGLSIIAKRADTYSTWPFHNFPQGKYAATNGRYLLRDLLRASSAAPTYFRAKILKLDDREVGGFIDGGVSLANNPGMQALMLATLEGYSLGWPMGADKLSITSVGTGTSPKKMEVNDLSKIRVIQWAGAIPELFMEDASFFNQALLQWMSDSDTPHVIDDEIGDLSRDHIGGGKLLHYNRYNVELEPAKIREVTGSLYTEEAVSKMREMDAGDQAPQLAELGTKAAAKLVKAEHFRAVFDRG